MTTNRIPRCYISVAAAATLAAMAVLCGAACVGDTIALVPVGDAGNAPDPATGLGAVPYVYSIGKYDVTTAQYTDFLNAVATTGDPYGLYTAGMATDLPHDGITRTSASGGFLLHSFSTIHEPLKKMP